MLKYKQKITAEKMFEIMKIYRALKTYAVTVKSGGSCDGSRSMIHKKVYNWSIKDIKRVRNRYRWRQKCSV